MTITEIKIEFKMTVRSFFIRIFKTGYLDVPFSDDGIGLSSLLITARDFLPHSTNYYNISPNCQPVGTINYNLCCWAHNLDNTRPTKKLQNNTMLYSPP